MATPRKPKKLPTDAQVERDLLFQLEGAVARYCHWKRFVLDLKEAGKSYVDAANSLRSAHNALGLILFRRGSPYDASDGRRYVWSEIEESVVVSDIPVKEKISRKPQGWKSQAKYVRNYKPKIYHY